MQCIKVTSSALLLAVLMVCCMLQMASAGYNFGYGVNDPSTGDIKDQQETKNGDQIVGYYRLLDSDGLIRTVNYQSHPLTGFTAQVNRDPIGLEGQAKYRSEEAAAQSNPAKLRTSLVPNNQYLRYDDGTLEGHQQW
ncbi:PREDICTED: larval/pupal rigid cuticle protein 66-like [Diuraphis noxia]|uniref:larval/pupal rigid cuticle protein 66-like n=1 Tax=Diuraphis noxia TaxID=143948 RepID=UPI000763AFAD|nr:PREDICTED: larval/pupal rigid cuticle protein 66-like [Diuraphis noxia]